MLFPTLMFSTRICSLVTFGNTPKVDTKVAMNENKVKNRIDHGVQSLHFKKEKRKIDI